MQDAEARSRERLLQYEAARSRHDALARATAAAAEALALLEEAVAESAPTLGRPGSTGVVQGSTGGSSTDGGGDGGAAVGGRSRRGTSKHGASTSPSVPPTYATEADLLRAAADATSAARAAVAELEAAVDDVAAAAQELERTRGEANPHGRVLAMWVFVP